MPRDGKKERSPTIREPQRVAAFRFALLGFLRETERVARRCGLTPQRYLLLLMIKGAAGGDERATVSELSERLLLAQSTVTELVDRAGEAGLIRRSASPDDARVAYVALTPEGERSLMCAFRGLAAERRALRDAIAGLDD